MYFFFVFHAHLGSNPQAAFKTHTNLVVPGAVYLLPFGLHKFVRSFFFYVIFAAAVAHTHTPHQESENTRRMILEEVDAS